MLHELHITSVDRHTTNEHYPFYLNVHFYCCRQFNFSLVLQVFSISVSVSYELPTCPCVPEQRPKIQTRGSLYCLDSIEIRSFAIVPVVYTPHRAYLA